MNRWQGLWGVGLSALVASCPGPSLQDQVAAGVARLAIRDAAGLVLLATSDDRCGFASPTAEANAHTTAPVGEPGVHTLSIEGCVLEFEQPTVFRTDCDGTEWRATGRVTVSGQWATEGLLTGNVNAPVAPVDPEASTVSLTAAFDGFSISSSADDHTIYLDHHAGTLSFDSTPRLAVVEEFPALCGFPTPHAAFDNVTLRGGDVTLFTDRSGPLSVQVPRADLNAQSGRGVSSENDLRGSIHLLGGEIALPLAQDPGLDPAYDRDTFESTATSCIDDTTPNKPLLPLVYDCPGFDRLFAVRSGQAMLNSVAAAVDALDRHPQCGFFAPGATVTMAGSGDDAIETRRVDGCVMEFALDEPLFTDCAAAAHFGFGRVVASGTRTQHGTLDEQGAFDTPVGDISYAFSRLEFEGFGLEPDQLDQTLALDGGCVAEVVRRAAEDETGACSVPSPILRFDDVRCGASSGWFTSDQLNARFVIDDAALEGVRGRWGDDVNQVAGAVSVNGAEYALFGAGIMFDSFYAQSTFDQSWACTEGLAQPVGYCDEPDD